MKKLFVTAMLAGLLAAGQAAAADFPGIKGSLVTARENLVAMLGAADASGYDQNVAAINKASDAVESGIKAAAAEGGANAEKVKELQATWTAFRATRDGELIPMLKAGKKDEAKALGTGIQAERYKKMVGLLGELGAP